MPKSSKSDHVQRVFLTFEEAQEFSGVSQQTLYKLMNERLRSDRIGNKWVLFKEDLIRWIKEY